MIKSWRILPVAVILCLPVSSYAADGAGAKVSTDGATVVKAVRNPKRAIHSSTIWTYFDVAFEKKYNIDVPEFKKSYVLTFIEKWEKRRSSQAMEVEGTPLERGKVLSDILLDPSNKLVFEFPNDGNLYLDQVKVIRDGTEFRLDVLVDRTIAQAKLDQNVKEFKTSAERIGVLHALNDAQIKQTVESLRSRTNSLSKGITDLKTYIDTKKGTSMANQTNAVTEGADLKR